MTTPIEDALRWLKMGDEAPFDESDDWWNWDGDMESPSPAKDWAHKAARGIIACLQEWELVPEFAADTDEEIRNEIVANLTAIIRLSLMDYS